MTIFLKSYMLEDGMHTGTLAFRSEELGQSVTVPVTATLAHSGAHFDENGDEAINIPDLQTVGDIDQRDVELIVPQWTVGPILAAGPNAPQLRVAAPTSVQPDATFIVDILADDAPLLGGFELRLTYDPEILEVTDVVIGDLLGSSGRDAAVVGPHVNAAAGAVDLGGYSSGEEDAVEGDGVLASMAFLARAEGASDLPVAASLMVGPDGSSTAVHGVDGRVVVGEDGPQYEIFVPFIQGADGSVQELYLPLVRRNG